MHFSRLVRFAELATLWFVGLAGILAMLLILGMFLSVCGCADDPPLTSFSTPPGFPLPGMYFSESGDWVSVAQNGVVNVACREHTGFSHTSSPPCGLREGRSIATSASFRGGFVSPDSAFGTLEHAYGLPEDVLVTGGAFGAKWNGSGWFVTTRVSFTDGCRSCEGTTMFETR